MLFKPHRVEARRRAFLLSLPVAARCCEPKRVGPTAFAQCILSWAAPLFLSTIVTLSCPSLITQRMAQAGYAGVVVSCPPCNTKMEVPAAPTDPVAAAGHPKLKSEQPLRKLQHHRQAFPLDVLPAELGQETNARTGSNSSTNASQRQTPQQPHGPPDS